MKIKNVGFSLMEVLMTIAILGVLLGIAMPAYHGLIVSEQIATTENDLKSVAAFAASEARRQGRSIAVISNQGKNWSDGYQVTPLYNLDNNGSPKDESLILSKRNKLPRTLRVTSDNENMIFSARGFLISPTKILICGSDKNTEVEGVNVDFQSTGKVLSDNVFDCDA